MVKKLEMRFKPWYVLLWAGIVGVGGSLAMINQGNWNEYSFIGVILHIGIPIVIYFILRRREKSKISKMI